MKKITFFLALFIGLTTFTSAQNAGEVQFDFTKHSYAGGGIFSQVSNNGLYAVGSSEANATAFVYDVKAGTLKKINDPRYDKLTENFHLWKSTANDVSDAGIVVGSQTFSEGFTVPAYYNIKTGQWTKLPISPDFYLPNNKIELVPGDQNGEATSISADGKFIGGHILSKLDNSTLTHTEVMPAPCIWINKGTVDNPKYELQSSLEKDHNKLLTQGDWAFCMSDDGKYLGGHHTNYTGCFNPTIWENKGVGKIPERKILLGIDSLDYDKNGGALPGQYIWSGKVSCISPSGEWIVGYHNFNGTGYLKKIDGKEGPEPLTVGFKYNTKTKTLVDSLNQLPSVVFDDGSIIYGISVEENPEDGIINILAASNDKSVRAGVKIELVEGLGLVNSPYLIIGETVANEIVKSDLNINAYTNNKTLYIDGDFTSIDVFSILGTNCGSYNNENGSFNLSHLNSGVYVIRIFNGDQFTSKKIKL